MTKYIRYVSFLMGGYFACFFISCNKELQPEEFLKGIALDAELNKKQEDETFRISCSYRPADFLALAELRKSGGNSIKKENFVAELKKFENALYFDLTVGLKNNQNIITQSASTQEQYTYLLSELTYNLQRDFYLLADGKDTVRALAYNYINTYGTGPDARFLFVFPKSASGKEIKKLELIYEDKVFGINHNIRFEFATADMTKKLPAIKFRT